MTYDETTGDQCHPTSALPSKPCAQTIVFEKTSAELLADEYKRQRDALLEFVQNAPVKSGVCCCGADITKQNYCDNHSSVDMWDHAVEGWVTDFAKFDEKIKQTC